MILYVLQGITKKGEMACSHTCASVPVAWPAMHWWAMADLFLSPGDPDSELHNLSTQLTSFPLVSCYHTNLVLQIPHSLCGAPQANPHLATMPFSLEPR